MNRFLRLLAVAAAFTGCADESVPIADEPAPVADSKSAESDPVSAAYLGLTVMDCQAEATECVKKNQGRFFRSTLECSAKLSVCLADATAQAAINVVDSADEVLACGTDSVDCVASSQKLTDVINCEQAVEECVVGTVDDLTGIKLPTPHEVVETTAEVVGEVAGAAVETVGVVVETGVEVVGEVADTAVEVVGTTVDTAVEVTGAVVETTVDVAVTTVETAGAVVEGTVNAAGEVVTGTVDAIDHTLECSQKSRKCWRDSRDFLACNKAYRECLRTP